MTSRGILMQGKGKVRDAVDCPRPAFHHRDATTEDGKQMRFFSWLFARTPTEADPPPEIVLRISVSPLNESTVFVPDPAALDRADAAEAPQPQIARPAQPAPPALTTAGTQLTLDTDTRDLGDAFCLIEYEDATGERTRRRISMRSLKRGAGVVYLNAYCMERRAMRQFRVDRITAMITEDGEILDPAAYFALQGVPLRHQTAAEALTCDCAARALAEMRPGLVMLAAVARADRKVDLREVDAVQVYAERELIALSREGVLDVPASLEVAAAMTGDIALMRPMVPTLRAQALRICDWPEARFNRLRRAMQEVIVADGHILPSELDLVEEFDRLLRESPHDRRRDVEFGLDEAALQARRGSDH
jgi:hypothetical protein